MRDITPRAYAAWKQLPPTTICCRYETGECMGVYLQWDSKTSSEFGRDHYLPADPDLRTLIAVLNSELRKESLSMIFEHGVEFNEDWQPLPDEPSKPENIESGTVGLIDYRRSPSMQW